MLTNFIVQNNWINFPVASIRTCRKDIRTIDLLFVVSLGVKREWLLWTGNVNKNTSKIVVVLAWDLLYLGWV